MAPPSNESSNGNAHHPAQQQQQQHQAAPDVTVEIVSESLIVPATPPADPIRIHFLSNLDLIFDNQVFYAQIVFLFRNCGIDGSSSDADAEQQEEQLMQSLASAAARLLDAFPPLAGRLTKAGEHSRTSVLCNGAGVPFIRARTAARLSDWAELRHFGADLRLNPPNVGIPPAELTSAPLIRLQATRFADAGIALGFSAMHLLVDGANTIDVMTAWGELHRGASAIAKPPSFDTWLLAAREPPRVTAPLPDNLSFFDHDMDLAFQPVGKKRLARHTFDLPATAVDALVAEVSAGPHADYGRVSSYEAVSALFWSCIARARGGGAGNSHFTIPVSLTRPGRVQPPLPHAYFGNAVIMTLATADSADTVASQHLSWAARQIHRAARSYEPELAKSVIDALELRLRAGKSMGISIGDGPPTGRDVLSTSMAAFPVYGIEFGFGRLDQCIFSFPLDIGEGLISVLPSPDGGRGKHVAVCLQEQHLDNLRRDPVFSKYCVY